MTLVRISAGAAVAVLSIAAALAGQPTDARDFDRIPVDRPAPPYHRDGDADGTLNVYDCNDDDPAIRPGATEILNGVDDDCDGTIDDGFDTSFDAASRISDATVWPIAPTPAPGAYVSLDAAPRIAAASGSFLVVWSDLADRLLIARVSADGTLLGGRVGLVRTGARAPDIAWTGSRLAVVYEDRSSGGSDVRLAFLDPSGATLLDMLVVADATEPRIAWGDEMFGVLWKAAACTDECVGFQRFDRDGRYVGLYEFLPNSGGHAAIAWSAKGVRADTPSWTVHNGRFGIVYEGFCLYTASPGVRIVLRDPWDFGGGPDACVNAHENVVSNPGPAPAIAGSPAGFGVGWHVVEGDVDRGHMRYFAVNDLAASAEYLPDLDVAGDSSLAWMGSEFVVVNENLAADPPGGTDIHFRRVDATCNPHRGGDWGPWSELNLSLGGPGRISSNPAAANAGAVLGVVWIEQEGDAAYGRVHFAAVAHR